jgi:hypothetical protein
MAGCWFANAEDIYREVERSIGSEIVVCITRGSNILLITLTRHGAIASLRLKLEWLGCTVDR